MSDSYQAETTLGKMVNIVAKEGNQPQVMIADDGTRYVRDLDQFGLLTPETPAEGEDGVEVEASSEASSEEEGGES